MVPIVIGISSAFIIIFFVVSMKQWDKTVIYGLILSGIGFLYVGFVWSDVQAFIVNAIQAIVFLVLAYYGIKKSIGILALGYFLHGCWDIAYSFHQEAALIPPHYDLFCSSLDFILAAYIFLYRKHFLTFTADR